MFRVDLQFTINCILFDHALLSWMLNYILVAKHVGQQKYHNLYRLCIAHVLELMGLGLPMGSPDILALQQLTITTSMSEPQYE